MSKEKTKSKKDNYRIIRIEKSDDGVEKKVTMKTFTAKDDKEAYAYLKKYRTLANKEYTYYYDHNNLGYGILGKDGKTHMYDTISEASKAILGEEAWYVKLWDAIYWPIYRVLIDKPRDFFYKVKDVIYFMKYKQYANAWWSLDHYLLDTIVHQLSILIEKRHGLSQRYIDMARLELHKSDKHFDLDKYNETHTSTTKEEEDLSIKIQNDVYTEIIKTIKLYYYYEGSGASEDAEADKMFDNDPALAIPYVPGTYKQIDYKKLFKMQDKTWNKIWEYVRTEGTTFWD